MIEQLFIGYFKFNLLLALAFGLWKMLCIVESVLFIRRSSRGRLSHARCLFASVLILPILIQSLAIQSPLAHVFGEVAPAQTLVVPTTVMETNLATANTENAEAIDSRVSAVSSYLSSSNVWSVLLFFLVAGALRRGNSSLRELKALKAIIIESQSLKKIGSVHLKFTDDISVPFATRLGREKFIIVPSYLMMSKEKMRIVLRHEGHHLRSGDLAWSAVLEFISVLCFWNPVVPSWKLEIHNLQEYACDEAVLRQGSVSRTAYAECLYQVAENSLHEHYIFSAPMSLRMSDSSNQSSDLRKRISALNSLALTEGQSIKSSLLLASLMLMTSLVAFGRVEAIVPTDVFVPSVNSKVVKGSLWNKYFATTNVESSSLDIVIEPYLVIRSIRSQQGAIYIGEGVTISGVLSNVYGDINMREGGMVGRDVSSLYGDIYLTDAIVGGTVSTASGSVRLRGTSITEDLVLGRSAGEIENSAPAFVGPNSEVAGKIVVHNTSKLYIHESARVGEIVGATPIYYADEPAPDFTPQPTFFPLFRN